MAESETALQAFDYTVLPANMCTVIRANTEEFTLHMNRSVQEYGQACVNVMNVHAALADRYSGRWAQWCQSVGLSVRSATRMVEVGSNVMGSAKLAELVQDGQIGKSLLQAICAPSAEPEAVDQVLSGNITTHKEYQELLAQLKAEKERSTAAEAREEEVWKMHEEARQRAETAESRYKAALADVNGLAEANQQKNKELEAARKDLRAVKECYSVAKMNEASQCERIKTLQEENATLKKAAHRRRCRRRGNGSQGPPAGLCHRSRHDRGSAAKAGKDAGKRRGVGVSIQRSDGKRVGTHGPHAGTDGSGHQKGSAGRGTEDAGPNPRAGICIVPGGRGGRA